MKDGKRECQIIGGSEPPFIINRNGDCVDPNHCASTALALAKAGASMVANAAEDAYAAAKERFKFSCQVLTRKTVVYRLIPNGSKRVQSRHAKVLIRLSPR